MGDAKERYAAAREHVAAGRLDEATMELVWLWQNIFPEEPSLVGVRVSFMANLMQGLARRHPRAREQFHVLRDKLTTRVDAGTATPVELQDWVALCDVLDDNSRVVNWYDRMGTTVSPTHIKCIEPRLSRLLQGEKRWADLGGVYTDPLRDLRDKARLLEHIPNLAARSPEHAVQARASIEQHVVGEIAALHTALCAAGRDAEASGVLEEARKIVPGESLDAAISKARKDAGLCDPAPPGE
jgi:hypothetical protein